MAAEILNNVMSGGRRGYEDLGSKVSSLPRKAASSKIFLLAIQVVN